MNLKRIKGWQLSIISIVMFFVLLELILRVLNFEYLPASSEQVMDPTYRVMEQSGDYFITRSEELVTFRDNKIPVVKDDGEIRIYFFGGSSVNWMGDLEYLKSKLQTLVPDSISLRLINMGGLGYGSERILNRFNEVLNYAPDVIVIYSGHNEFVEDYFKENIFIETPMTKFSDKLMTVSRSYQFLTKKMQDFFQWAFELYKPGFLLHQSVPLNKEVIYQRYAENLTRIATVCEERGIQLVLSTVAYNRMAPPNIGKDDFFDDAVLHYEDGDFEAALKLADKAADEDLRPLRANKTSNAIVRSISEEFDVPLVEADKKVVELSRNHLPDYDIFADHCHPKKNGYKLIWDEMFETFKAEQVFQNLSEVAAQ